ARRRADTADFAGSPRTPPRLLSAHARRLLHLQQRLRWRSELSELPLRSHDRGDHAAYRWQIEEWTRRLVEPRRPDRLQLHPAQWNRCRPLRRETTRSEERSPAGGAGGWRMELARLVTR